MWRSSLIQSTSSSLLVLVLILVVVSITTSQTSSKAQYSQDGKELRQDEYEGMNRRSNAELLKLKTCDPSSPIYHLLSSKRSLGWWNGRHVRLRGVCRKACGFKSRPEHSFVFIGEIALSSPLAHSV